MADLVYDALLASQAAGGARNYGNVHVAAFRKRADHRPHASPLLRLPRRGGK